MNAPPPGTSTLRQVIVLRVDVKEEPVCQPQFVRRLRADCGESQNGIGAIAVVIDQLLGDISRAAKTIGANCQPGHRICGNFLVLAFYFSPGDLAVGVGVEADGEIKVA
jgi:hypothetical protein